MFLIHDQELELETSEIYFIIGLSHRGELIQLYGGKPTGVSVNMILAEHCPETLKSKSGKVDIMTIHDLVLKVLLLTINRVVGAQASHESNKSKFQYDIDCMSLTIFNWVESMKVNMKHQLSKCKAGNLRKFGYGYVLVTFFLEWIPLFHYQLEDVNPPRP